MAKILNKCEWIQTRPWHNLTDNDKKVVLGICKETHSK